MYKKCTKCEIEKEINSFAKQSDRNNNTSWCKQCLYDSQKKRWIDRKVKAVNLMGGKCQKCGYDKNFMAMDFHHKNPDEKEFNWCKLKLKRWSAIIQELKKCILLCCRCHREEHWPQGEIYDNALKDNVLLNLTTAVKLTGECLKCGKEVYGTKYCSVHCSRLGNRKVYRPQKKTLKKLISTMSWCAIGRKYGVSDNAVRKWAKKYKLII
jgi:hypothetical protein